MKRRTLFLLLVLIFSLPLLCDKAVIIADLGRPVSLDVDANNLYIIENAAVYIYSLKNFTLIKKFGEKGQGPGEFNTLPHVHITLDSSTDRLIIGSIRKISYYSKRGNFIKEVKGKNLALRLVLLDPTPGGEKFLGWSQRAYGGFNYNTIVIFDGELNKIQQVYREKDPFQGRGKGYDMLPKTFSYLSHQGSILLPGKDDASVDVFDLEMKHRFTVRIKQDRYKVTEDFRKKMINYLKSSPETKNVFPVLQPIRFPKYFPVINSFFADDGVIYVMTWKRENGRNEFYTYNMQGGFRQKKMIPVEYETDIQPYPAAVKNGNLYQLVENQARQEWELRITRIR